MVNFMSALDVPMDKVERPKPPPTGTYVGVIAGLPTSRDQNTKDGEKEILEVLIRLTAIRQLDDPSQADGLDLTAKPPLRRTFWFNKPATPEDLWSFKQFCANTLSLQTDGKTGKQVAAEMQGRQLLVTVGHRPYQDRNSGEMVMGADITATAAL